MVVCPDRIATASVYSGLEVVAGSCITGVSSLKYISGATPAILRPEAVCPLSLIYCDTVKLFNKLKADSCLQQMCLMVEALNRLGGLCLMAVCANFFSRLSQQCMGCGL